MKRGQRCAGRELLQFMLKGILSGEMAKSKYKNPDTNKDTTGLSASLLGNWFRR